MQGFRTQFECRGLSRRTVDVLIAAWRDGTKKQYASSIKLWREYCKKKQLNCYSPNINDVLEYLSFLFYNKELSYSAINTARSALSFYCVIDQGHLTIGAHPLVSKFMKGVFNMKPPKPRYMEVWDARIVLNYLRKLAPARTLSLQQLTLKVVVLIALTSAQRAQSLHKISLDNCTIDSSCIVFHVKEIIKQSRPGRVGCVLTLPAYKGDRRLCPVLYIKHYIERTKNLRGEEKKLFVSYKKPHGKVTVQTISRWIKCTLRDAGIDTNRFKAHSTRAASTSAAKSLKVPIEQILSVAGWANERTFREFYNKPIQKSREFAKAVLDSAQERN